MDEKLREQIVGHIDLLFKKQNCGYSQDEMDVCSNQILKDCEEVFHTAEAFPKPLLCPKCSDEGRLLTDNDIVRLVKAKRTERELALTQKLPSKK